MGADWKSQRKAGIAVIIVASAVTASLWFGIRFLAPPLAGMENLGNRMLLALYCCCFAMLFCLVTGIEAVAHERLRSPAFDPLTGYRSRRLEVNQRYLQNTLEQTLVFVPGIFGLAAYSPDGGSMRAVIATTIVWILGRLAFWIGYHRSAAMRGAGIPGMAVGMLVLLYVVFRIGRDAGGLAAGLAVLAAFLVFEAILFWGTRPVPSGEGGPG